MHYRVKKPGKWEVLAGPKRLTPIPGGLGFTVDGRNGGRIGYNGSLKRFELTSGPGNSSSSVFRAPLVRVSPPSSDEDDAAVPPKAIGIPNTGR